MMINFVRDGSCVSSYNVRQLLRPVLFVRRFETVIILVLRVIKFL